MSDLTFFERRKLEDLFGMKSGFVLDFSNRTFAEFMAEHASVDVYSAEYDSGGSSKAWRLRTFWAREPNHIVGRAIDAMIRYAVETGAGLRGSAHVQACQRVAARLKQASAVHDMDALQAPTEEPDFEVVAQQVRDAINKNQPEAGLDRLHTFVIKFMRSLCEARGIVVTRDRPLHSLVGEYLKILRSAGHLESDMTERIIKSSISTMEAFNTVRNDQSLAHDNRILNYDESLLIFNHVASTIRFLRTLEERLKVAVASAPGAVPLDDDIPF